MAQCPQAPQMALSEQVIWQMAEGGFETEKVQRSLQEILTKVGYIESRMDSAECKIQDLLRHLSQHVSEYSAVIGQGDQSILRSWILSLKSAYFKAGLRLGLPEDQIAEAWSVLISCAEAQVSIYQHN